MSQPSTLKCVGTLAAVLAALAALAAADAATRTWDIASYTLPEGWKLDDSNTDHVTLSLVDTKTYCMIGLYKSRPAGISLAADFASEWRDIVNRSMDPTQPPSPQPSKVGGATALSGARVTTWSGHSSYSLLVVVDAGTRVTSIYVTTPSREEYLTFQKTVDGLLAEMRIQRTEPAPTPVPPTPTPLPPVDTTKLSHLNVPAPTRPITVADLVGDWSNNGSSFQVYVSASTGQYAGTSAILTAETWHVTADGVVTSKFRGYANGVFINEEQTGPIAIMLPGLLGLQLGKNVELHVLRGWLDLPQMTVMKLNGPYWGTVPPEVLKDPHFSQDQDKYWVRQKPTPTPH